MPSSPEFSSPASTSPDSDLDGTELSEKEIISQQMQNRFTKGQIEYLMKHHVMFRHTRHGRCIRMLEDDEPPDQERKDAVLSYLQEVKAILEDVFLSFVLDSPMESPIWLQCFEELQNKFYRTTFFDGGSGCFAQAYGVRIRRTLLSRVSDSTEKKSEDLPANGNQRYISTDIVDFYVKHILHEQDLNIKVTGTAAAKAARPVIHTTYYTWSASRISLKFHKKKFDAAKVWKYATRFMEHGRYHAKGMHVFPVCESKHWFLLCLDFKNRKIIFIDPLGGNEEQARETDAYDQMLALLAFIFTPGTQSTRAQSRRHTIETKVVPEILGKWTLEAKILPTECQQKDVTSCGVFVIMLIDLMKSDASLIHRLETLTSDDIGQHKVDLWRYNLFVLMLKTCKSPYLEDNDN